METTPIDEKPSEDSKRADHEPGAATDRPKMSHAATSYGADGRKRRRSIIDRLSFGLLADPWRKRPWGAEWRSSSWFITFVVAFGVATDIMTYSIIVPVAPYRLQSLGYDNVAALNSYLLVAYSAGLVLFTPICAFVFHRFPYRRAPLLGGLVVLQLALVLFAVATPYWCMIVARLLMGIGSAVVWNVGMAMICENVPQEHVGRQLGFAMSGVSIGGSIGPVLGGVLYDRLGWHAPFIFSICICAVEFIGRLIIIERKEVKRWGIGLDEVLADVDGRPLEQTQDSDSGQASPIGARGRGAAAVEEKGKTLKTASGSVRHLTPIEVLVKLSSSPRALTAVAIMFMFALIIGGIDPTLPLRAQDVWNKDSLFVGIIYLVASVPTFFTGPLVGHLADKFGAEWMAAPCLLLSLPFFPLLILKASFAGFVIVFMLASELQTALRKGFISADPLLQLQTPSLVVSSALSALNSLPSRKHKKESVKSINLVP